MNTDPTPRSGSIVVAVDGSHHADLAVAWAAKEARLQGRPLMIVHAERMLGLHELAWITSAGVSPREITDQVRAEAEELTRRASHIALEAAPGVEIDTMLRVGDARDILLDLADRSAMIALGSRGRGPVTSLLLGSVSIAVSRRAACPVVVVRPSEDGALGHGVLVGTNGSAESIPTLEVAFREASLHEQPLTVVHCVWEALVSRVGWGVVGPLEPDYEEARLRVAEVLGGMPEKFPDVEVTVKITKGAIDECIADLSRAHELTVVGRHARALLTSAGSISLTTAIVENAFGPVLVVP